MTMLPDDDGSDRDYFVARQAFSAEYDGETVHVAEGERIIAGHPLIEGREDCFELDTRDLPRGVSPRQVAGMHALVTAPGFPPNPPRIADVIARIGKRRGA